MSKRLATWCQDTLEDKTSFSHVSVTVSPSKMISGMIENFVSSGNPKERTIRMPKPINGTDATHQMSPPGRSPPHPWC